MVHAIALSRLRPDDIADAVQETFFRALRRLSTLRQADAFGTWLGTIARNVVRDVARTRVAQTGEAEEAHRAPEAPPRGGGPAGVKKVPAAPKGQRENVAMGVVKGMTGPEIAHR